MLQLARGYEIAALQEQARRAFSRVSEIEDSSAHDWAAEMPTWRTRTKRRGLLGWGETRKGADKDTVVQAKGAITTVCRAPIMKALDYYFIKIGVPPVIAGESRRKAIAAGRYFPQPGDRKKKKALVPLQPPRTPINLLEQCLLTVASAYNLYLDPVVEDGTDASVAVLALLRTPAATKKLLGFIKGRYLKLGNKQHLSRCAQGLNKWVREGDWDIRMEALRTCGRDLDSVDLTDTEDPCDSGEDLFKSLAYEVVSCMVLVAAGRTASATNDYGFFPMGEPAAVSTNMFKMQPDSPFAIVLAEVFPFVTHDVDDWGAYLRKRNSPALTNLWPFALVKRHTEFAKYFRIQRQALFAAYEAEGGEYHGAETAPHRPLEYGKRVTRRGTMKDESDDSASSTEDEETCYEIDI